MNSSRLPPHILYAYLFIQFRKTWQRMIDKILHFKENELLSRYLRVSYKYVSSKLMKVLLGKDLIAFLYKIIHDRTAIKQ